MQHQNKIAVIIVVLVMASALYWHRTSSPSLEPGMVKELEYVIDQQAKEIESLKEELKA